MKTLFVTSLALTALLALAGCSTVHGVGQDVNKLGRGIEHAADGASR